MTESELDHALQLALEIARRAGALLLEGHRRGFSVERKAGVELVTDCDLRAEQLVVASLREAFPDHAVLGEEGGALPGSAGATWLVDPLDGTTNYAHRLPFYAVSIALELEGEPAVGVVLAPALRWEFSARRGAGARMNGAPIHVSGTPDLDGALLATGFPYDRRTSPDNNVPQFATVLGHVQGIRRVGAASLDCAMVASGLLDGYWEYKLQPWDIAAGALLVSEAGGRVTDTLGGPHRSSGGHIVATNGHVHEPLLDLLRSVPRG